MVIQYNTYGELYHRDSKDMMDATGAWSSWHVESRYYNAHPGAQLTRSSASGWQVTLATPKLTLVGASVAQTLGVAGERPQEPGVSQ